MQKEALLRKEGKKGRKWPHSKKNLERKKDQILEVNLPILWKSTYLKIMFNEHRLIYGHIYTNCGGRRTGGNDQSEGLSA